MSNQTPESWEDELSRQAEGVNLNAQSRPQGQAPSFTPGAASFTPGAASFTPGASSFVPGQQYQQYAGYPQQGYPQYGQQQAYGGYQQQQQYGAYNQQPRQNAPVAAPAQSAPKPAANAAAPKAKVLSIGATSSSAAPKTKVLSIGTPTPAPKPVDTTPKEANGDTKGSAAAEAGSKVAATKSLDKSDKAAATG